ncbi:MAG: hypothetical protein JWR85_3553 [Marmoricola sp.]|nr:hypothetical protein [Marmoricola sp.]
MSDFHPAKLAFAQSDEIEISLSRDEATLVALCLASGLRAVPDDVAEQTVTDDVFDLADRLANYGRTGIDHPDACFCISCGQPDEPELHDPAKCPPRTPTPSPVMAGFGETGEGG